MQGAQILFWVWKALLDLEKQAKILLPIMRKEYSKEDVEILITTDNLTRSELINFYGLAVILLILDIMVVIAVMMK